MNKTTLYLGALLLLASLCCHAADGLLTHNQSYRRFTTIDGLSQMQTETVWQDSRGYIYIGTLSGFVRYDGLTMTPFLRGRRENIVGFQEVEGRVRAMGFLRQWTIDGDDATMTPIDPDGTLLLNNFNAADLPAGYVLLEDRQEQNRVLCQVTAAGMKRVMASPLFDEMPPDRKLYIDIHAAAPALFIYVPTPQGLYRLQEGQVAVKIADKGDVFSLIRTADGLCALAADGLYSVGPDSLTLLSHNDFEAPDYGLSVRQNRQGQLLIADSHTIWLYERPQAGASAETGPWRQIATGFNLIKGLFVDRWNRLWAATYQGAYCFFHCNFENHRLSDQNDIVRAMAFSGGQMVMGTLNGKVIAGGRLLVEDEKVKKELQLSAVRLKAIPHFHSNVLASIEYFVSNHSTDDATHYLKLYSDFTNQTLSDIDLPSRPVADEVDYVRAYLELEKLRYGERLQYTISVAPDVDQQMLLPTMLLHTYCQNAVKHGIANKSGLGNVTVSISRERRGDADGLTVSVSDDGVGRSEAAHAGGQSTKQGLKILSQQIELYNRANRHKIVEHVTDLTTPEGHPAGTCFSIWIPSDFKY